MIDSECLTETLGLVNNLETRVKSRLDKMLGKKL
jgi:hypothetical protein